MKRLNVKLLPELHEMKINEVGSYLSATTLWHPIKSLNWPDLFAYKPIVKFMIARSETSLYIHFKSEEKDVKAIYTNDHDPVWQDSCVEFFALLPNGREYVNFEFNCIGTALASRRLSRDNGIVPFSTQEMASIERFSSLGRKPLTVEGKSTWELTVNIPLSLIGLHDVQKTTPLRANLYKCGDETANPHYLSWSEIETPTPNFHCPEYFGTMNL